MGYFTRRPVVVPRAPEATVDTGMLNFANKASAVLGYTKLEEDLERSRMFDESAAAKVRRQAFVPQILSRLEIPVIDPGEIKYYKETELNRAMKEVRKSWPWWVKLYKLQEQAWIWMDVAQDKWGISSVALFALLAMAGIILSFMASLWFILLVLPFVSQIYFMVLTDKARAISDRPSWWWVFHGMLDCVDMKMDIPPTVLAPAIMIKEEFPEAWIGVEMLVCGKRRRGDRFLVLRDGDANFYLDSWSPPEE